MINHNLKITGYSLDPLSVILGAGVAHVDADMYFNSDSLALPLVPNDTKHHRIDAVVLRKSWEAHTIRAAVVMGAAEENPKPPTLTEEESLLYHVGISPLNENVVIR